MPGSTNFVQWNPNAINQENDAAYAADSVRAGGAPVNAIFPSALANKGFFQWSIFITAFAQMLAGKGYSPNDGSAAPASALANLEAVLTNVMTQADMSPWALLNSPVFTGTPAAPTPATNDNSTKIATTAFVQALVASMISGTFAPNGFVTLFGTLVIQWGSFSQNTHTTQTHSFTTAFPTSCLAAFVCLNTAGLDITQDTVNAGISPVSASQFSVSVAAISGSPSALKNFNWFAIGH